MCYSLTGAALCRIERGRTSTLLEFLALQNSQLSEVSMRLQEFHSLTKEIVRSACRTALLEYGFLPDDYLQDEVDLPANLGIKFSGLKSPDWCNRSLIRRDIFI